MKKERKKHKSRKWSWDVKDIIDPHLTEKEISDVINRKLAYIIIELEHNPVNYIKMKKDVNEVL